MSWNYLFLPQGDNIIRILVDQLFRSIPILPIQDTQDVERATQIYIRDKVQTYEISIATFFASTLESIGNSLHFNNPYHLDKWPHSMSESK